MPGLVIALVPLVSSEIRDSPFLLAAVPLVSSRTSDSPFVSVSSPGEVVEACKTSPLSGVDVIE